ncbi:hypothetical protein JDV02_007036 [Purpureocillium takamizusanense]|uniref:Uncharacterized protein n=1 Tax=Purpureocillium takamizusanense TaxID=2060973 RepID=A0A9Q8VCU0_9HYPO|nr:uncharacterized protein JDV02_007036 [Purpureocillium takamizusanense]UNI21003.1 hypothetical protein JDV02_007036 [Purpureocillium takamizusanense]
MRGRQPPTRLPSSTTNHLAGHATTSSTKYHVVQVFPLSRGDVDVDPVTYLLRDRRPTPTEVTLQTPSFARRRAPGGTPFGHLARARPLRRRHRAATTTLDRPRRT